MFTIRRVLGCSQRAEPGKAPLESFKDRESSVFYTDDMPFQEGGCWTK